MIDLAAADGASPDHVASYASADVTDEAALSEAFTSFGEQFGPIRGVVHCAGRGGDRVRILDKDGNAAPLKTFAEVIKVNLFGTYNVLRLGARRDCPSRADRRRAWSDRAHRVSRGVRRPDRPNVLHRKQSRRPRHHVGGRSRSREPVHQGQHDRTGCVRHSHAEPIAADIREALESRYRIRADSGVPTTTPTWLRRCWRTPTSTGRLCGSTGRSGCHRDDSGPFTRVGPRVRRTDCAGRCRTPSPSRR